MKKNIISSTGLLLNLALVFILLTALIPFAFAAGQVTPGSLTTEYAANPLGIDVTQPRLGWKLTSGQRAQRQTAYRVLVAATQADLAANIGGMWDSGKVVSDETVSVIYNGLTLQTGKRYFWKVCVWDKTDVVSDWSPDAWFEMSLLGSGDWQGSWIGWDRGGVDGFALTGVSWIWYPEGDPKTSAPVGTRYFRRTVTLASSPRIKQVVFGGTADDQFILYINGKEAARGDAWGNPVFADLTGLMQAGSNSIAIEAANTSAGPAGLLGKLRVTYSDGTTLTEQTGSSWKTANNLQSGWEQLGFNDASWSGALQIATYGDSPWGSPALPSLKVPAPLLRKEFAVNKTVSSARVYVCGLGYYELHINGAKVGDSVLDPGFTRFNKRQLYTTYDVTGLLQQGTNCLGVELGRGFYGLKVANVWNWQQTAWNSEPKLRLQLNIAFSDGTSTSVVSDTSWKVNAGPTTSDAIYCGDTYDARREKPGWDSPGYAASGWVDASVMAAPSGQLHAQMQQPIKVAESLRPVGVTNPKANVFVFDAGKVTSGWAKLTATGASGIKVYLKYGEKLYADGTVDAENGFIYEPGHQTDSYIFKGQGTESWEPKFSYKGFRYVEVGGYPGTLTQDNIQIRVIHSAVETIGSFTCSNPMFNTIHDNTVRTILNNLHAIPTDTPMYEKNGWMGDGNVIAETAIYNLNMERFYAKWVNDMEDSQSADGLIPVIAPADSWGMDHSPEWNTDYIYIPWNLYLYNGDQRVLEQHYDNMKRYIEYEISHLSGYIATSGLGDWLAPGTGGNPPEGPAVSATVYVYGAAQIMGNTAALLGKSSDATRYSGICTSIKNALNSNFLDLANNAYHSNQSTGYRQTPNILPVAFGMAPDGNKLQVVGNLAGDVNGKGGHLDTGILGTKYILPVLTDNGYGNVAFTIANQTTYPSWGYWIANGATTNWEAWDMSSRSRDHYMNGTVDEWFYKYLAGIRPATPGFKTITIKPYLLGDLQSASGQVDTVRGTVSSGWSKGTNNTLAFNVTIPTNTTATVYVPASSSSSVTEGGIPAGSAPGVQFLRDESGYAVYSVGSGTYAFASSLPLGNLASGAAVTASSSVENADWGRVKVNDGTRGSVSGSKGWTSDSNNSVNHTEYVRLDFGTAKTFNQVDLYPRNDGADAGYGFPVDFTIDVSNDGSAWTNVLSRTGYPFPTGGAMQSFTFSAQTTRYLRVQGTSLRSNPNDFNFYRMQLAEIEIYYSTGATATPTSTPTATLTPTPTPAATVTPTPTATPTPASGTNLALNKTVASSSSVENAGLGWGMAKAVDGERSSISTSKGWSSNNSTGTNHTEWITVDLGASKSVNRVDLYPRNDGADTGYGFPVDFTIKLSADNTNWTTVITRSGYGKPGNVVQSFVFGSQSGRYVRIEGTGLRQNPNDGNLYRMQFAEFEVYYISGSTLLFADDFSGDLSKWANTANASINSGQLTVTNNEDMRSLDGANWTNYTMEADVKITNIAAGLVFRGTDSNNCYMWQLSTLNGGKLRPHKKVGGTWTLIKEVNTGTVANTTYHVKIEANGSTIKAYIDGILIDTTTDTAFGSGKVGFRECQTEAAVFDNVVVNGI
jgi:alpha-L-rhamnosidase